MSESSSKLESQLSFFGDHQNAFTNLKMEAIKEFSDDEFSKEDEEMMETKQLDERSNNLTDGVELKTVKHESGPEASGQFKEAEIGRLGEPDRLSSQLSELPNRQIDQPNESGYEPRNESEATVNASSLLASSRQAEQQAGEAKPESGKPADSQQSQHLISSLNSLIQQSNSQQSNQFSQVSVGLKPLTIEMRTVTAFYSLQILPAREYP